MNIPLECQRKYPRATKYLLQHPKMTIDEAIDHLKELLEGEDNNVKTN